MTMTCNDAGRIGGKSRSALKAAAARRNAAKRWETYRQKKNAAQTRSVAAPPAEQAGKD